VKAEAGEAAKSARGLFAPIMKQYSWKCVNAATPEEFESLWKEMVTTCKSYGYDDVVKEKVADIQRCFEYMDSKAAK